MIILFKLQALFRFVGIKSRTKEQLQRLMYHEEMDDWMENARIEDMRLKVKMANTLAVNETLD